MKKYRLIFFTCLYFLLALLGIFFHEIWMDEAQHILLARDSSSLNELIYNARYEGHPFLWNFLLYFLMGISSNVLIVQIAHILISSTCVFIILKYSPFKIIVNLLICFGYYLLYEYSIISRNYSLSLFFVLLILVQLSSSKRNYTLIFIFLGLLFNTHIFSVFIGLMFVPILWNDLKNHSTSTTKIFGLLILGISLIFCLLHIIPPSDHFMNEFNHESIFSLKRFRKSIDAFSLGFLPIPDLDKSNFWSNSFLINHYPKLSLVLSLGILFITLLMLIRHKTSFFFFYGSALLISIFIYFTPLRLATRHCGFLAIAFFAAVWLSKILKQESLVKKEHKFLFSGEKVGKLLTVSILILQFFSGVFYYYMDLQIPFSSSKKAAEFINTSINKDECVAITHFTSGPPLSLYTNRSLFYLEPNHAGSFCEWNTNPISISDSVMLDRLAQLLEKYKTLVLICNTEEKAGKLLTRNYQSKRINDLLMMPIETQDYSIVKSERYYFYKVSASDPPPINIR